MKQNASQIPANFLSSFHKFPLSNYCPGRHLQESEQAYKHYNNLVFGRDPRPRNVAGYFLLQKQGHQQQIQTGSMATLSPSVHFIANLKLRFC